MATLPDSAALGERPVPRGAGTVAAFEPPNWRQVGMAGQFLSGAGGELEQASSIVAATNDRQDQQVAQAAANNLQQQSMQFQFDTSTGFQNAKEGNAVGKGFIDSNTQRFTDASQNLRTALLNDNQRRIFDLHSAALGQRYQAALLQHQAQQTDAFNDTTANNTVSLALRSMAARPDDELNFQTNLSQINGTIDQTGQRKGLPATAVAETKAKMLDAAYTTRIMSLMNGVPGAVQANPYRTEQMFRQVQDQLGPQSQVTLGREVQKSVQSVQARDTAQSFIFGSPPPRPSDIPAAGKPLQNVVMDMESGGRRFGPDGQLLTSPAGAKGEMQVMGPTAKDPGFGVRPAQDDSPEELARVGRDYLGAMSARYGDPALTLAAYNAGPGQVDKWIARYGDPRTGQISAQDWAQKIPFAETQAYVVNGLRKMNDAAGTSNAPIQSAPTANMLKTDLYQRVQAARALAAQQYPGDTAYADAVATRVENYGRMVIANQQGVEAAAHDGLVMGTLGTKPDGSDKPLTIDALLADPQQKANWEKATPEVKAAIQAHFAAGATDKKLTQEGANAYYALLSKAGTNPEEFVNEDLSKHFGEFPDHMLLSLMGAQKSINSKDAIAAAKGANITQAHSTVDDMLKPMGLGRTAKANSANAKVTEQFYGRLDEAIQTFHDQNGKWPQQQDVRKIAGSLLTQGAQSGGMLWDSATRAFQVEDQSKFYVPLPPARSKEYADLVGQFTRATGHAPSGSELQQAYTRYKMSGGK